MMLFTARFRGIDGLITRQPLGRAPGHAHHAERDDEWHHPKTPTTAPLTIPMKSARQDGQHDGRCGGVSLHEQGRPDHAGERHDRANAQIDAAADDDHGHAQGSDGHDHRLRQDDLEIARRYKIGHAPPSSGRTAQINEEQAEKGPEHIEEVPGFGWWEYGKPMSVFMVTARVRLADGGRDNAMLGPFA